MRLQVRLHLPLPDATSILLPKPPVSKPPMPPGGLDTRDPVRVTEWQDRCLARDWLVTSCPWNRDEDYDTVVKSTKGSYEIVG